MQVAGDLAVDLLRRRLMTESERAHRQFAGDTAPDSLWRIGIVVAGQPQPVTPTLQNLERRARRFGYARRAAPIVNCRPTQPLKPADSAQ